MKGKVIILATGGTIAGAGAGEFSEAYKSVIDKMDIPVVVCSHSSPLR